MTTTADEDLTLPEYRDNPFIAKLPPPMSTHDALLAMAAPPAFNAAERDYPAHLRAHCISRLKGYFEPLETHLSLEAKFGLLIRQGYLCRNPTTADYTRRVREGATRVFEKDLMAGGRSVRSTASSFALIGCSGIGKSYGMARILELYPQKIHHAEPRSLDQVVWLKLDSPHKGSPKQLCINFFRSMDDLLGTRYSAQFGSSRRSVDEMMVHMAHVANLHALGVLIVDEIQHIREAPGTGAEALLNFLVTLVNTIGIPVILIGTMGALPLLQGDFRQARRASGLGSLVWERMENEPTWNYFVERMWTYQWTREISPLTDEVRKVLYEESQGIVDVLINLFMMAQLRAIQLGVLNRRPERIDAGLLRQVASEHMRLIAPMINALKRGDREAIAQYDDIRPMQDQVLQVFSDALSCMPGQPVLATRSPVASATTGKAASTNLDVRGILLPILAQLGLAGDIAEILVAEAEAEHPGLSALDLVGIITAKLRDRAPANSSKKPRKSTTIATKTAKTPLPVDAQDLRTIISAKKEGVSAYDALLAAGAVKPPMADLAS
ncbi:ATP-binding protein [Acidithiobacillus ferriphilus]|uniref:ATP-binding protein n=1 Tax=Acidithiobacillus ferriphilus TaxID=1689834 RepID=UPI00232CAC62|nr:ATP-binding protein [Acidithiobacillus ferriphilus]WCE93878.1 ATP-binding protein [Acidithiobacillus ferriphilus]